MRCSRHSFLSLIATLALVQACGSDNPTTPPAGSISLGLTPTSVTIQQGGSTQVSGTVTRTNFTGDIAISVVGAPTGVSGTVTLAPVNGGNSAQVVLSAASSTAIGVYALQIVGKGTGIDSTTATFTLTIAEATSASYTMVAGTPSQSIAQGGTAPSSLTFVRTAFTGGITLSAENLPTGVTAAFSTNPVIGNNSTVTFTATPTAPPGTFNTIRIRGTSAGVTDVTASITLVVTVTGSFTIAAGSNNLNLVQGNNTTTSVNATRAGSFAGTILYSVTGPANAALPVGLSAAVTPTATADQNTLTVTAATGLAAASYPMVVHATSLGLEQTASVTVVVSAGGLVRLDYSACVASGRPIWVAAQDGTGPFTRITGTANVYTFNIASAKGAFAIVTQTGALFSTVVQYFSQAEIASLAGTCTLPATGKTINGTISGIGSGDAAIISMGGGSAVAHPVTTAFQLFGVASGLQDLVAYRHNSATPLAANDGIIIRRDLNVADGGSLAPISFVTPGEALSPTSVTITVNGAQPGNVITQNLGYLTGSACTPHELYSMSGTSSSIFVYGVPSANQRATDYYRLALTEQTSANLIRTVTTSFHTLAARSVTMPGPVNAAPSDITTPQNSYRLLQLTITYPADRATLIYTDIAGTSYSVIQSAGYLGGAGSSTMTATDLGSVAGYLASWGPSKTGQIDFVGNASTTSGGQACNEGSTTLGWSVVGSLSVP